MVGNLREKGEGSKYGLVREGAVRKGHLSRDLAREKPGEERADGVARAVQRLILAWWVCGENSEEESALGTEGSAAARL